MRFTSLIVELVRAKPRLFFWSAVLLQAALWLIVPTVLYTSPPGNLATVLAFGREYQVGTGLGPPLSFWLADVAFRFAGGHVFGVYLLAQICFVITMWAVFTLARAIVGAQQATLVALLTLTIVAFTYPGLEFGPDVLARPLWALTLLHAWRVLGQGRRTAWFALSMEVGLLFLTTPLAGVLVVLLAVFVVATHRGRQTLASFEPLFGALVVLVVALPYFIWLLRIGPSLPHPSFSDPAGKLQQWAAIVGGLGLAILGILALVVANSRYLNRKPEDAPVIYRPPVDPFAKYFVLFFGCVPPVLFSLAAPFFGLDDVAGGAGLSLLLTGLVAVIAGRDLIYLRRQHVLRTIWLLAIAAPVIVVIVTTVLQPWSSREEVATTLPSRVMGKFFADNYRLRANVPLSAVAGDPQLTTLLGMAAPSRPHVLFDRTYGETPWFDLQKFKALGGLVVWRAADTIGAPPPDIAARFPGLVPEVPRIFNRLVDGRLDPLRIGWAVVRPPAAQSAK
jgi:4-amino-4-deoxy-L-arabinose transferase-like glycosyltransferase